MSRIQFSGDNSNFQIRPITKRASALERFLVRCGVPQSQTNTALIGIFIICTLITLLAVRKVFNTPSTDSFPKHTPEMQQNMPHKTLNKTSSKKNTDKRGFTMMELLVVISIIGMLSSFVLVGLASVRQKANNSYTTIQIGQYVRAILSFANDNNRFPDPSPLNNSTLRGHYCIGTEPCVGNAKLKTEFLTVMSSLPNINKRLLVVGSPPYTSQWLGYSCHTSSAFICTEINISWQLEGEDRDCTTEIPSDMLVTISAYNTNGNTSCWAELKLR